MRRERRSYQIATRPCEQPAYAVVYQFEIAAAVFD
jgi:hypothetical protein